MMIPLLVVMAIGPMLKWKRDTIREGLAKLMRPGNRRRAGLGRHPCRHLRHSCAGRLRLRRSPSGSIAGSLAILAHRMRFWQGAVRAPACIWRESRRARSMASILAHAGHRHRRRRHHGHVRLEAGGAAIASDRRPARCRRLSGDAEIGDARNRPELPGRARTVRRQQQWTPRHHAHFPSGAIIRFAGTQTTEAGIHTNLLSNVYLAIGEKNAAMSGPCAPIIIRWRLGSGSDRSSWRSAASFRCRTAASASARHAGRGDGCRARSGRIGDRPDGASPSIRRLRHVVR